MLRVSGVLTSTSRGLSSVGIALFSGAEHTLLDWIPGGSHLHTFNFNRTLRTQKDMDTRRCFSVISSYTPTDCSSDKVEDELYRILPILYQNAKRSNAIIVAGDLMLM